MRFRDQLIEIVSADIVLCKDDDVVRRHLADGVDVPVPEMVHLFQGRHIPVPEHLNEFYEDLGRRSGVVHGSVVVFQGDPQRLCHNIELIF